MVKIGAKYNIHQAQIPEIAEYTNGVPVRICMDCPIAPARMKSGSAELHEITTYGNSQLCFQDERGNWWILLWNPEEKKLYRRDQPEYLSAISQKQIDLLKGMK
jgi:hypothetical protein